MSLRSLARPARARLTSTLLLVVIVACSSSGCTAWRLQQEAKHRQEAAALASAREAASADVTPPHDDATRDNPPRGDAPNAARQREVDDLVAQALAEPQIAQRTAAALRASDRAVAGLADTLAAIDAAERVVVDNLRNADTVGYKAVRPVVGEARDVSSQLDCTQGALENTSRPLDVAVSGDGFVQVQLASSTGQGRAGIGYSRNGNLFINPKGELVLGVGDGYKLLPPVVVPTNTTEITIASDGTIDVTQASRPTKVRVGQLTLVRFTNPSNLRWVRGGLYAETAASGPAMESKPGDGGCGTLLQGFLEPSNVDLTRERLRLRFLHHWRETILAAIDGDARPGRGAESR